MIEFNPNLEIAKDVLQKAYESKLISFKPSLVVPYTEGGGSLALKVKNQFGTEYAVRFPRKEHILQNMLQEKKKLDFINSENVSETSGVIIPSLNYVDKSEIPFVWHKAIKGDVLYGFGGTEGVDYNELTSEQKFILSQDIAKFMNAIHSIPIEKAKGLIAPRFIAETKQDIIKFFGFAEIDQLYDILSTKIPDGSFSKIEQSINDLDYSDTICHFDLHGRNMAIDKTKKKVLNGIFDFGDVSINKRVADFYKLSFVHRDLMRRVVSEYNKISAEKVNITDVDFIYLAAMARFLEQSPKDGIINNSVSNFSNDYSEYETIQKLHLLSKQNG